MLLLSPVLAQSGQWSPEASFPNTGARPGGVWASPGDYPWGGGGAAGFHAFRLTDPGCFPAGRDYSCALGGTVTGVLDWPGWGGDPPPSQQQSLPVLVTASASGGVNDFSGELSSAGSTFAFDDGFGDPVVPDYDQYGGVSQQWYGQSSGRHLVMASVSQGADGVWRARTPACTMSGAVSSPTLDGDIDATYQVQQDTRAVTITSNLGQTYHRGSALTDNGWPQPVLNTRMADGTLYDDTIAPDAGSSDAGTPVRISYSAPYTGTWGSSSTYLWYSSLTQISFSDYFSDGAPNPLPFGDLGQTAIEYNNAPAAPSTQEHVYVHLTDSNDGANATANYYLNFHAKYEPTSWPEDPGSSYKVQSTPDPDAAAFGYTMPTYPWQAERTATNSSQLAPPIIGPASSNSGYTWGSAKTTGISFGAALGVTAEAVTGQFSLTGDESWSTSDGMTLSVPQNIPPGYMTWGVWRFDVQRHKGHLDCYGVNGYTGTGIWYRDEPKTIDHQFYWPYQNAGTTTPYDPPAGWNPPGY